MFDNLYQTRQGASIGGTAATARIGVQRAEDAQSRVQDLEERVDKLSLLNLALWTLLKERTDLTDAQLQARVEEIDLQDGQLDGRTKARLMECPNCHRPLHHRHRRCLYCDYQVPQSGFEAATR